MCCYTDKDFVFINILTEQDKLTDLFYDEECVKNNKILMLYGLNSHDDYKQYELLLPKHDDIHPSMQSIALTLEDVRAEVNRPEIGKAIYETYEDLRYKFNMKVKAKLNNRTLLEQYKFDEMLKLQDQYPSDNTGLCDY